uniref:DNA cross-link repair 1A protein n=1 Tax=Sphenodon punctatus TaxID=8508 RepID=A0A8D0GG05_SPHPU
MFEDRLLEEDIWEYQSVRKLQSICHNNNNAEVVSTSLQKTNDSRRKTKRSRGRNKKQTLEDKDAPKKREHEPTEKSSQVLELPNQNLTTKDDQVVQSQGSASTPAKRKRTPKKKQSPPNARPIYDGYCPSCQMPFSLLLVQTPRWHITECLDAPGSADKECPDGLLCTSTIPSHYRRYTHFLLAASRDGDYLIDFPTCIPESKLTSSETAKPNGFLGLKDETLHHLKDTRNVIQDEASLMRQSSAEKKSQNISNIKASSSTDIQKSQQHFTQSADNNDQFECSDFPLSQESQAGEVRNSQDHSSHLIFPETDSNDCDISYSPLNTDEENNEETEEEEKERIQNSRKRLFHSENFEDKSTGKEDSSWFAFNNAVSASQQRNYKYSDCIKIGGFIIQNEPAEELNLHLSLDGVLKPVSQDHVPSKASNSTCATNQFKERQGVVTAEPTLPVSYGPTKGECDWPKFSPSVSSAGKRELKGSGAFEDLVVSGAFLPLRVKEDGAMLFPSGESGLSEELSSPLDNKGIMISGTCGKSLLHNSQSVKEKNFSSTATGPVFPSTVSKTLPSVADMNAKSVPAKELKQMDIGVFFGLPRKAKEETSQEKTLCERSQTLSPSTPNGKRPRQRKRKAEGSVGDSDAAAENSNKSEVCVDEGLGGQRRWRKRYRESSTMEDGARRKQCPFYKKIPGTSFVVDAFQYGEIEGCTAYFLTHFNSDHYGGLTKNFAFPIYCNKITGNLVKTKLRVQEQYVRTLPMNTECVVNGIKVVLLDANHCPGAAMILFSLPNGTVILHTGDFRADPSMERSPLLVGRRIHTLYLDTTYCSPQYTFPSQQETIQFVVNTAFERVTLNPRTLVVCGTYSIGKEKVFLAVAEVLGSKVSMSQDKFKMLQCLESETINSLITVDWNNTLLHLLPMMRMNFKDLQNHLSKFSGRFDQVLAFKPTGWTYSGRSCSLADIQPQTRGKITLYGIPYS